MTDNRRTLSFGGLALALLVVTWATAPRAKTSPVFADRGQTFFPQFTDPNAATSLEVVQFDPQTASARPFRVQNQNGRWTIPSQYNYPTDAKDRLAQTSAAIIALKRDDVASDTLADHERTGVIDPLDTTVPTLTGRGTRITVRGAREQQLADIIVGNPVAGKPGFRYVRQPGQRRVYVSNVGPLNVSTAVGDWIERDLLQVNVAEIDAVNLRNYSLDRATGRVDPGETMLLQRKPDGEDWSMYGLGSSEHLDIEALDMLLRNLIGLRIASVLPKPPGISATLRNATGSASLTEDDIADLRRKGFYLAPTGQLVSNRGEVVIRTTSGVFYTLRFGDVAPGTTVAASNTGAEAAPPGENRYMFIMVDFDPNAAKTPARANEGADKTRLLRARFAPWYYVIAADSFAALQPHRVDLVKPNRAVAASLKPQ
jgi:hypothetical protein